MRTRTALVWLVALLLAVPLALASPAAASSGKRPPIDPLTLNPPLENGSPACTWRGSQIVCQSTVPQTLDLGTYPSGLRCGDDELLQSAVWSLDKGIAYYNAARDIVALTYIDSYTGSFSNPATGKTVAWRQKDVTKYAFATPGDNGSGTATFRALQQVYGPGGSVILTDAGTEVFSFPDYTRLESRGHHPIDDFFYAGDASGLGPLCAALA